MTLQARHQSFAEHQGHLCLLEPLCMALQDMFGTLQQGNSPVKNRGQATASGDRWIEDVWSKGKAVNAPQLPSHREFADILQQTYDNPYKSARPEDKTGDAWLTSRGKGLVPAALSKHRSFTSFYIEHGSCFSWLAGLRDIEALVLDVKHYAIRRTMQSSLRCSNLC